MKSFNNTSAKIRKIKNKKLIEERATNLAHYIVETKDTVRGTAKKFGISKSTVHKDVSERLLKINPKLASEVRSILEENKAERHIRGGMATKLKYSNFEVDK
jgi:putative DeoR family transcriptional regulator (stage III sporulation protein D)